MPIPVAGVGHVLLYVRDVPSSIAFYENVLGCEVLEQDPEHGGTFMTINAGSHTIDLHPVSSAYVPASERPDSRTEPAKVLARIESTPGVGHVGFPVASAEALRDGYFQLVDKGIPVLATLDHGSQQSVYFCDPDDNILEIYWERPGARAMFLQGRSDVDTPLVFKRDGQA